MAEGNGQSQWHLGPHRKLKLNT